MHSVHKSEVILPSGLLHVEQKRRHNLVHVVEIPYVELQDILVTNLFYNASQSPKPSHSCSSIWEKYCG